MLVTGCSVEVLVTGCSLAMFVLCYVSIGVCERV